MLENHRESLEDRLTYLTTKNPFMHINSTVTHEDNMVLMSRYPDNYFDLAIVDPPYGINAEHGTNRKSRKQFADKKMGWDACAPDGAYFTELFRVSKNQIIWGGITLSRIFRTPTPKAGWSGTRKTPTETLPTRSWPGAATSRSCALLI